MTIDGTPDEPEPEPTGSDLPIFEPETEIDDDDDPGDEEPRTVLIPGAAGNTGRKLWEAWQETYELVLLDQDAKGDPMIIEADLADPYAGWIEYFHGADVVVHLAGNPDEFAEWEALQGPNLDALANVLHASVLAGVDRVIFASSNHAMGGYRGPEETPITVDLPPLPDGPYGATKLFGERLGRSLAHAFDLAFVALRLGWVQKGENRPETLPDDWARSLWLSNVDLIGLFTCAVEAELDDGEFVIVNGLSNNSGTRW